MENDRFIQQHDLLASVLEVFEILKQRRPDLDTSIIPRLAEIQALLFKDNLLSDDLDWIYNEIGYLCHFKCLYDFCPLELLEGEKDQERWQRWGEILDRMKNRANLLCGNSRKKNRHKQLHE